MRHKWLENIIAKADATRCSAKGKRELLQIFENMVKARCLERKVAEAARKGLITKKFIFSGAGQEGGQATVATLLEDEDMLIPPYRGFAAMISRGEAISEIVSAVFGEEDGPQGGLGFPMNFTKREHGIIQNSNILGLDFGSVLGVGLALKQKNKNGIAALFFGDGAAARGPLWSALNISVLWRLPVLWVCENNQYSVSTHVSQSTASPYVKRAEGNGVYAQKVDGNNPLSIYFSAKQILTFVRTKKMPAFLELDTYRVAQHDLFFFTDQSYQNRDEREKWGKRDPLLLFAKQLSSVGILSQQEIERCFIRCEHAVDDSFVAQEKKKRSGTFRCV